MKILEISIAIFLLLGASQGKTVNLDPNFMKWMCKQNWCTGECTNLCPKTTKMEFAVTDGLDGGGVPNADVKADSKGGVSQRQRSGANGKVEFGPFAPKDQVIFIIVAEGYDFGESVYVPVPDSGGTEENPKTVPTKTVPVNPTTEDLRLILSWGAYPRDLDNTLLTFNDKDTQVCFLNYRAKNGTGSNCHEGELDIDRTNGGLEGHETITVKLPIPEGLKFVYYIHDFSGEIGGSQTMTWAESLGSATIYGPNNQGSIKVPFDIDERGPERFFVVGCFDNEAYSGFKRIGKLVNNIPDSADICDE